MKIKYNYLPQEFSDFGDIFRRWEELIKSTEFTLGKFVIEFEKKFAKFMDSKYCISTNNGTDALILALRCLGIGKGDEVITVTNSFYATVGAIVAVGATPVLVDSDDRFQIDIEKIGNYISSKTKAIIPVHWGGASPDMNRIRKICQEKGLLLIEDACMAIGGKILEKSAGTFGDVSAFSMHPLKSLNVMGDGGMVLTDDQDYASWMLKYRNHGMVDRDNIDFWGVNMRLQPLQAIVASIGLDKLEQVLQKRRANVKQLDAELSNLIFLGHIHLPERIESYQETCALFMGLFNDRDRLKKFLYDKGIETKIHYPKPLHLQKASQFGCIFDKNDMKKSEYQAPRLLTLPVHQFLGEKEIKYISDNINMFYKNNSDI